MPHCSMRAANFGAATRSSRTVRHSCTAHVAVACILSSALDCRSPRRLTLPLQVRRWARLCSPSLVREARSYQSRQCTHRSGYRPMLSKNRTRICYHRRAPGSCSTYRLQRPTAGVNEGCVACILVRGARGARAGRGVAGQAWTGLDQRALVFTRQARPRHDADRRDRPMVGAALRPHRASLVLPTR